MGHLAIGDHRNPVHDDVVHALGELVGLFEGRGGDDLGGIEHDDVRVHAGLDHAALGQSHPLRGQRGELADCIGQCQCVLLFDVLLDDLRKRAVGARVGVRLAEDSPRLGTFRVVADRNPRLLEHRRHVRLIHPEYGDAGVRVILDHDVQSRIERVFVPGLGDVGDALALQGTQRGIADRGHHYPVGPRCFLPFVVPQVVLALIQDVRLDLCAGFRILQAREQLGVATRMRPRRHDGRERIAPRGVGVGVGRNVQPLGAGVVDRGDDARDLAPVGLAGGLEMENLDRNVCLTADLEDFVDRGGFGIAFVAHVGRIDPAVTGGDLGQCDQFIGGGVGAGRVLQRTRQPHGAVLHGGRDQRLHLLQLRGRRLHILVAEHHPAHRGCPDVGAEVDADALFFEPREITIQGAPGRLDAEAFVTPHVVLDDLVVERCDRVAFARDLGGDALVDFRRQAGRDEYVHLRLAQHVDEAGRHDPALRVDGLARGRVRQPADRDDAIAADGDVAVVPGRARAVDDPPVPDDEVVFASRGIHGHGRQADRACKRDGAQESTPRQSCVSQEHSMALHGSMSS